MTGPNPTGGESLSHIGSQVAEGSFKTFVSGIVLVCIPVIILADLLLGPGFLWAQAVSQGIALDTLSVFTPILFSITMTGLQYALWQTAGEGGPSWIRRVAWGIAIADTLCDIGGLNWALTQDADAGKYFFPIEGTGITGIEVFGMYTGGIILFFHERLLRVLLEVKQGGVNSRAQSDGLGNAIERAVIFGSGVVLNIADFITKNLSVFCILVLDVVLTPQLVENTWPPKVPEIVLWVMSLIFTAITFLMWRWVTNQGGVKAVLQRARMDKKLRWQKHMLYGFFFFLVVDTLFDMSGYNYSMYEFPWPWINDLSVSWILTMLMLIVLCGMGDILFRTLFSALGDKARRIGAMKKMQGKKPKAPRPKKGQAPTGAPPPEGPNPSGTGPKMPPPSMPTGMPGMPTPPPSMPRAKPGMPSGAPDMPVPTPPPAGPGDLPLPQNMGQPPGAPGTPGAPKYPWQQSDGGNTT